MTDPRLFDAPLRPIPVAPTPSRPSTAAAPTAILARTAVPPSTSGLTQRFATPTPQRTAVAPRVAARTDFDEFETFDEQDFALRSGLVPVSARTTRLQATAVAPALTGRSMGGRRATATPTPAAPTAFSRTRDMALAACAVAVVGAAASAAVLLPSTADAMPTPVNPTTSPIPTGAASAKACFAADVSQTRARARHHHRRAGRLATPFTRPASTATPDETPAATATATPASPVTTPTPRTAITPRPVAGRSTPIAAMSSGTLPAAPSNLGSGIFTVSDFSTQSSGAVISGGALQGAGVGKTVVQMVKGSSTKASSVPSNGNNQGGLANPVNPLFLLRGVTDLEDVTVQGTEQGHMYNGVYMTGANLAIKHVEINDIPGNSNANPGETFAIGVNRASGTNTVDDVTINGGSGSLASSAGLAINNSDANWNISDLTANNLRYSAGIALWQVRGTLNVHNYVQNGGARALGAERLAGTVNLYDPKWSAGTTGHDVTYTWDGGYSGGSINFYYSLKADVPDRKIAIITNKASGIAGSVHVYIGGVQQTTSNYVTVN